jgi:hypothetical protein
MNPVHIFPPYFLTIHSNIIFPHNGSKLRWWDKFYRYIHNIIWSDIIIRVWSTHTYTPLSLSIYISRDLAHLGWAVTARVRTALRWSGYVTLWGRYQSVCNVPMHDRADREQRQQTLEIRVLQIFGKFPACVHEHRMTTVTIKCSKLWEAESNNESVSHFTWKHPQSIFGYHPSNYMEGLNKTTKTLSV